MKFINWKLKAFVQFALAYIPGGEQLNFRLQLLRKTHAPQKVRKRLLRLASFIGLLNSYMNLAGKTVVEVGTGWDAINTLMLYLLGAKTIYTYDHVAHVRFALVKSVVQQMYSLVDEISEIGSIPRVELSARLANLTHLFSINKVFEAAGIRYVAPGDAARTGLPDQSIDLVYSYSVLEHVPKLVVDHLVAESKRILKRDGLMMHCIGEGDDYASFDKSITNVNFLQYPEWIWKLFILNRISYQNRLREKEFLQIFEEHGAKTKYIYSSIDPRDLEALKTMNIDRRFSGMTDQELAVNATDIILSF